MRSKNARFPLMVAAASTIRAIRPSSESTGDVPIRDVIWPHRKTSNIVRSGDLVGQAIEPPLPIQLS